MYRLSNSQATGSTRICSSRWNAQTCSTLLWSVSRLLLYSFSQTVPFRNLVDRAMPGNKITLVGIYCIKRNVAMGKVSRWSKKSSLYRCLSEDEWQRKVQCWHPSAVFTCVGYSYWYRWCGTFVGSDADDSRRRRIRSLLANTQCVRDDFQQCGTVDLWSNRYQEGGSLPTIRWFTKTVSWTKAIRKLTLVFPLVCLMGYFVVVMWMFSWSVILERPNRNCWSLPRKSHPQG